VPEHVENSPTTSEAAAALGVPDVSLATAAVVVAVAIGPNAVPPVFVHVITPVATTSVQSPDIANPPKVEEFTLYWIEFVAPPGVPDPPPPIVPHVPLSQPDRSPFVVLY